MSLDGFFEAMVPLLSGQQDGAAVEAALGPCSTGTEALDYYATLQRWHRERQLAELFPATKARIAARGEGVWSETVGSYLRAHPPSHWSLPHVGQHFGDWLFETDPEGAMLGPLTDWMWTRFLAHTAPDTYAGDGMDVRLFVRQYPFDPIAANAAVQADPAAEVAPGPVTLLLWRDEARLRLRHKVPSLATIAVLWRRSGQTLQGPLAAVPPAELAAERARLFSEGALPPHRRAGADPAP